MTAVLGIENTPEGWGTRASAPTAHEAAGWTRDGQLQRFARVLAAIGIQEGESLLDFGCGAGALVDHLPAGVDYVGYDWSTALIWRARADHSGVTFQDWEPIGEFDAIVCIGPFNLRDRWSKQHTWWRLRALAERTRRVLAVCLYAGDDPECIHYELAECERFAAGVEARRRRVELWRRNDILVVIDR